MNNNKVEGIKAKSATPSSLRSFIFHPYTVVAVAALGILATFKIFSSPAKKEARKKYDPKNVPSYRVAVLGATGCTGAALVQQLLARDAVQHVTVIARRNLNITSPKLQQIILPNFDEQLKPENQELQNALQNTQVFFNCHGTTYAQAGSAAKFRQIDYHYTMQSGLIAKHAQVPHYYIVTSMGSNKASWFLYPRTKGEIEHDLAQQKFTRFTVIRPSLLLCDRGERKRFAEQVMQQVAPYLNVLCIGPLLKYKAITVEDVARAMIVDAETHLQDQATAPQVEIIENDELHEINAKL